MHIFIVKLRKLKKFADHTMFSEFYVRISALNLANNPI